MISSFGLIGLMLFSVSLIGMEPTQAFYLVQQGITTLCEHSRYFGYSYSATLKALACTNKQYAVKIAAANKTKQNILDQEVMKLCENLHPFDNENFTYNWIGDACGWKQPFCSTCLSPGQCTCNTSTEEAALYRVQSTINGFDLVHNNTGWSWKPKQSIAQYKTCIESPILKKIFYAHERNKAMKTPRTDWDNLNIPNHGDREPQWDYIIPYSSKPYFNPDNSIGVYEITSKYPAGLYYYNARQQCIDAKGNSKFFLVKILFDLDHISKEPYSLASIAYMPKFVDTLLQAKNEYSRSQNEIIINANKILSDVYNLSPSNIELLRHMLPNIDTDYTTIPSSLKALDHPKCHIMPKYKLFLSAARCAQIGGASEKIIWHFLSQYEREHTKQCDDFYRISISPFGKLRKIGNTSNVLHRNDIDPLPILAKYTIDNVDQFHQEMQTYYRDIIIPPKHKIPDSLTYFIEICRKANTLCTLHVWTRGICEYTQQHKYTCAQHHTIESDPRFALIDKSTYMVPYANTKLAIILGSTLHCIQKIDNKSHIQSIPLLTDNEIEDIEPITADNSITVHIKPIHWWQHFFRPIKNIYLDSLQVKPSWNIRKGLFNPSTILRPLFFSLFDILDRYFISRPIDK